MGFLLNEFERVVFIGNGFDLNMGYKTSYKDFYESKIFNVNLNSSVPSTLETPFGTLPEYFI